MNQNDDDDKEETRLRDQFAIAAMQAFITEQQFFRTYIQGDELKSPFKEYMDRISAKIERMSVIAYKIADEMRKARLKSFG